MDEEEYPIETMREDILTVQRHETCSKALSPEYVDTQIGVNRIFCVMYNKGSPIAYILADFLPKQGVYIDLICSVERVGTELLSFFFKISKILLEASYVKLSSLMHVLTYYPRFGFSHRTSCDAPPDVGMSAELRAYILDKMKSKELLYDEDYFDDPKIARFIDQLHKHGFTRTAKDSCKDRELGIGQQKQRRCSQDGYTMIKCLEEDTVPPATLVVPFEDYVRTQRTTRKSAIPRELQSLMSMSNLLTLTKGRTTRSSKGKKTMKRTTRRTKGISFKG